MAELILSGSKHKLAVMVDEDDMPWLLEHRWYAFRPRHSATVYARTYINGRMYLMHRAIMRPPRHLVVDHIDRNGLNNMRSNLRVVTSSENAKAYNQAVAANHLHFHKVVSKGRAYYYHRPSRTRLPDDPDSAEFQNALQRLNREHRM